MADEHYTPTEELVMLTGVLDGATDRHPAGDFNVHREHTAETIRYRVRKMSSKKDNTTWEEHEIYWSTPPKKVTYGDQ